ncbi:glutamine amidotransferase-related protein [Candidatus Vidania fulgoroideorum]
MISLIENLDSFTYNIKEFFIKVLNVKIFNCFNSKNVNSNIICLSSGGGQIYDSKFSISFLNNNYKNKKIIGICLGHQILSYFFGCKMKISKNILHGKTSKMFFYKKNVFQNFIPLYSYFCRYNSITILINNNFSIIMKNFDNEVMFLEHKFYPIYGIQFHPESINSNFGKRLIKNVLFFLKKKYN